MRAKIRSVRLCKGSEAEDERATRQRDGEGSQRKREETLGRSSCSSRFLRSTMLLNLIQLGIAAATTYKKAGTRRETRQAGDGRSALHELLRERCKGRASVSVAAPTRLAQRTTTRCERWVDAKGVRDAQKSWPIPPSEPPPTIPETWFLTSSFIMVCGTSAQREKGRRSERLRT